MSWAEEAEIQQAELFADVSSAASLVEHAKPAQKSAPLQSVLEVVDLNEQDSDKELVYIDVRTWFEHKLNNIEGDPRIHISSLVEGVEAQFPDKTTPIRLYCAKGVRSGRGVKKLTDAGYLDVQNVGGISDVKKRRFGEAGN